MGGAKEQCELLAPVVAYFETKGLEREGRDLADKRFVRSVQDLLRAEEQDQTQWAERRRRIIASRANGSTKHSGAAKPMCRTRYQAASQSHVRPTHGAVKSPVIDIPASSGSRTSREDAATSAPRATDNRRGDLPTPAQADEPQQKSYASSCSHPAEKPCSASGLSDRNSSRKYSHGNHRSATATLTQRTSRTRQRQPKKQATGNSKQQRQHVERLDLNQAMTRIGELRSRMVRGSPRERHDVALEMAELNLVLSDPANALKNFQIAVRPSPEHIPTQQERDEEEAQQRKLMLLDDEARAKAVVALQAEEAEHKRVQEELETARRKRAATGVYQCLLELKQPVAAAEAARVRLGMCDGDGDGGDDERTQVEKELHETLLRYDGLIENEATNQGAWLTESAGALADLHASILHELCDKESCAPLPLCAHPPQPTGMGCELSSTAEKTKRGLGETNGAPPGHLCAQNGSSSSARGSPIPTLEGVLPMLNGVTTAGPEMEDGEILGRDKRLESEQGRRLRDLGRVLAFKRQFTASRQAFEDAIRIGPEEASWRERNRYRSKGYYLDMALDEATPSIKVDIESRWQSGVKADEIRRRNLPDLTGFTGVHRGAETVVVAVPSGGWARGMPELPYADRLSRAREVVYPLQEEEEEESYRVAEASLSKGGHRIGGESVIQEQQEGEAESANI